MIQLQASASGVGITDKPRAHLTWRAPAVALLVALAIAPFANIVAIIATSGADNLSNDYLAYTWLVTDVLSGSYDWSHYFRDSFYRTHSVALPLFLHILDARLFHWSIYPELYVGMALAVARLQLLYQSLSVSSGGWLKWSLLPVLSWLVFSTSQVSVYAYGDSALTIGLAMFGLALGIWGLVRGGQTPATLLIMLTGGLIASFSWGNGLVIWLVFLVALALLGYRKRWHYAVWLGGFFLSALPYALFLPLPGISHLRPEGATVVSLLNWRFVINALGWPFASEIAWQGANLPEARAIGWTGIVLASTGIALVWRMRSRELWQKSVPSLLIIAHGLLSVWQISVFRSLMAVWYKAVAMSFWIGLCALAMTVLQEYTGGRVGANLHGATSPPPRQLVIASRVWAGAVLVFLTIFYLRSNLTCEDKSDFRFAHSPASASALRNYRSAPTYSEGLLFNWGDGNPGLVERLAHPLEKHHLSAFAPRQLWTLQGDFLLDRVRIREHQGTPDIIWTAGNGLDGRLPWNHFKHLNLVIAAPNVVTWTVDLPSDLETAEFVSAAAISESAPKIAAADGAWCKVDVRPDRGQDWLAFAKPLLANDHAWHPLKIDLTRYKGRRITIGLTVLPARNRNADCVVYEYPRLEILCNPAERKSTPLVLKPANTDLCPEFTATTEDDFVLPTDDKWWQISDMAPAGAKKSTGRKRANGCTITYRGTLDLDLCRYSHFWVKLAVSQEFRPLALTVKLKLGGRKDPLSVRIPLLPDGNLHAYTYDLKLLELDQAVRLIGLSFEPVGAGKMGTSRLPQIPNMRFIHNKL